MNFNTNNKHFPHSENCLVSCTKKKHFTSVKGRQKINFTSYCIVISRYKRRTNIILTKIDRPYSLAMNLVNRAGVCLARWLQAQGHGVAAALYYHIDLSSGARRPPLTCFPPPPTASFLTSKPSLTLSALFPSLTQN